MGETTQEERDDLRDWSRPDSVVQRLVNDADRLAAIERALRETAEQLDREANSMILQPSQRAYDGGLARRDIAVVLRVILDPEE